MEAAPSNAHAVPLEDTAFLDWFALTFKAPIVLSRIQLGEISYHRAFAIQESGLSFVTTGRGPSPIVAAVKAASEFIERKVLLEYRRSVAPSECGSCLISPLGDLILRPEFESSPLAPQCIRTSNGWAVHQSREGAIRNALTELIERHCLILSFLKFGWAGFSLINELTVKDIRFLSCVARSSVGGHSAGLILGILPSTGGVGLGYMAERTTEILTSPKWRHAFFESYDNIETFNPLNKFPEKSIEALGQEYLKKRFANEPEISGAGEFLDNDLSASPFEIYDLKKTLECPTPLFAAHVTSADLIPLFFPGTLDADGADFIKDRLRTYGDFELPERMPVL